MANEDSHKYLLGLIMAEQMATELHIKAFMEIVRALGEQFPAFATVKDQTYKQLLARAKEMRSAINGDPNRSDAFLKGFNSGADRFEKFLKDVS